jgi:TusA-related sulfurtransferase
LYLNPAGVAAMKDMKNGAVVSAVADMESAIKILPGSIKFDFSSENLIYSLE